MPVRQITLPKQPLRLCNLAFLCIWSCTSETRLPRESILTNSSGVQRTLLGVP